MDAVIGKASGIIAERANIVLEDKSLSSEDKMLKMFQAMKIEDRMGKELLEDLHKAENMRMHQKSLVSIMQILTPKLTMVVEEGNQNGAFHCEYPEEFMQIFLASATTLFDEGIFQIAPEKEPEMFTALIVMLEKMLGVEKGRFLRRIGEIG